MALKDNPEVEFIVSNTQIRGGFVCHYGNSVEVSFIISSTLLTSLKYPQLKSLFKGPLSINDTLTLHIDTSRRKLIMNNHTGTHILNFALRTVMATEPDQKGSHVAPERLRFDFSSKGPLTNEQLRRAEEISNAVVNSDQVVYAKEATLASAKAIKGLRAVFNEAYPDPVRVVSIGVSVEELEGDPLGEKGIEHSVEFCGGT